jgi:hypothetical protein
VVHPGTPAYAAMQAMERRLKAAIAARQATTWGTVPFVMLRRP